MGVRSSEQWAVRDRVKTRSRFLLRPIILAAQVCEGKRRIQYRNF